MKSDILLQIYIFFIFILNGLAIGIIFDTFRTFRKSFKTSNIITYLEDILFWIISGAITLYLIFRFNNGELRSYIFIGVMMGVVLYILFISKLFLKVSYHLISIIKNTLKIILLPINILIGYITKLIKIVTNFCNMIFQKSSKYLKKINKFIKKVFKFNKKEGKPIEM